MEDKNFDKIFAHKFGQLPGEPYREAGWSELSGRLDVRDRRRRRWLLPVLLPLFGLLTTGNVFWWYQWREAMKGREHKAERAISYQSDTLVHSTVVYRYDTIYQDVTVIKRRFEGERKDTRPTETPALISTVQDFTGNPAAGTSSGMLPPEPVFPYSGETPPSLKDNPVNQATQDTVKQKLAQDRGITPGHTIVRKVPVADSAARATLLPDLPKSGAVDSLRFERLMNAPPPTKKVRRPLFYFARPRIGITTGWGHPMLRHKRSGALFGAGISADVEFARRFRLGAEVTYWQGRLKADEADELHRVNIPDPGNDYRLKYWETYRLPAVTYALHLRYTLPVGETWSPWIGAGVQAATMLPFEIEFDFENQTNNLEIFLPGETRAHTRWQGFLLMLGVEGRIGSRFSLGAEGFLLKSTDEHHGILDNQIGLKTRLHYIF